MPNVDSVIFDNANSAKYEEILKKFCCDSGGETTLLIEKDGLLMGSFGEEGGNRNLSFATLVAGNLAATVGLSKLLGQREYNICFPNSADLSVYASLLDEGVFLAVFFNPLRTSLEKVRKCARAAEDVLNEAWSSTHKQRGTKRLTLDEEIDMAETSFVDLDTE